jgi:SAM-dependent methyltransferase
MLRRSASLAIAALRHGSKRAKRFGRRVFRNARHLVAYRVPGESRRCPACGDGSLRNLAPLASHRSIGRFGFITGCRRCGVIFANPLPTEAEMTAVYSPEGEWGRHRQEEHEKQVSAKTIAALFAPAAGELNVLNPPPGAAVLDFGCGLGGMLDAFAAAGWETYGIDPATKVAFDRHRELTALPAEPRFDLAVLHHVLEHVSTPLDILRSIAAATKPGGYLLVSVPNLDGLPGHGELKYCIRSGVHVLAYRTDCLTWLLADAGFHVVSSTPGHRNPRRRVVLARRGHGTGAKPADPLRAAVTALGNVGALPKSRMPVRLQAALADLRHLRWRA